MATADDIVLAVAKLDATVSQSGGVQAALLQGMTHHIETLYLDSIQSLHEIRDGVKAMPGGSGQGKSGGPGGSGQGKSGGPGGSGQGKSGGLLRRIGGWAGKGAGLLSKVGGAGKGLPKMAQAGLGELAGAAKFAGPIGAAAALGEGLLKAGEAVKNFAYEQEAVARRLAQVSPSQAANLARLDTNRQLRDLGTGEATAGSGKQLTESIDRFEKTMQPIEKLLANVSNTVGAKLLGVLTSIIEPLAAIAKKLGWGEDNESPELFGEFLGRVAQEQQARGMMAQARIDAARRADARAAKGG